MPAQDRAKTHSTLYLRRSNLASIDSWTLTRWSNRGRRENGRSDRPFRAHCGSTGVLDRSPVKSFPASVSEGSGFRVCPGLADLIAASSENWGVGEYINIGRSPVRVNCMETLVNFFVGRPAAVARPGSCSMATAGLARGQKRRLYASRRPASRAAGRKLFKIRIRK